MQSTLFQRGYEVLRMLALSLCPLFRDICALLALFAPSAPPPPRPDPSSSSGPSVDPGLLGWLLQHPPAAAAGLELATQALTWPDTEAAQKALILAAGAAQVRGSPPHLARPHEWKCGENRSQGEAAARPHGVLRRRPPGAEW
jgi:hypothetical protein